MSPELIAALLDVAKVGGGFAGAAAVGGVVEVLRRRKAESAEHMAQVAGHEARETVRGRASLPSYTSMVPGRPRILVVDDEGSFARLLRRTLSAAGLDVDIATTAADARVLAGVHPYVLLLVDLRLPDGNGLDLLVELRQRTCIYSGAALEELEAARATGVADIVLSKDADLDSLLAVVTELLRRSLPPPAPAVPPTSDRYRR